VNEDTGVRSDENSCPSVANLVDQLALRHGVRLRSSSSNEDLPLFCLEMSRSRGERQLEIRATTDEIHRPIDVTMSTDTRLRQDQALGI
jgi:hypothetical protein